MAEFTGQNLYVDWAYSGTTYVLSGDYRSVSWNPSIGMVESTAGSDPFKSYLTNVKDTTADVTCVMQAGSVAIENAMREGNVGTLTVGPEGTAAGKRKYTLPGAISQGAKFNWVYTDVVELACSFQGSGTATYGTY